jgi:hypothetical protein
MYVVIALVCILLLSIYYVIYYVREAFTKEDLPITISTDNKTLTIPSTLKVDNNQPLNVLGDMTSQTTHVANLTVEGTSTLGTATATTVKIGNSTLTNQNGLTINTNVQCNNLAVSGDLRLQGDLCIERDGHRWYLISRGGFLHIVKNDPNLANSYDHRNNEPHVIIAPDGNIWTARSNFSGWIGDSLNWIRSLGV